MTRQLVADVASLDLPGNLLNQPVVVHDDDGFGFVEELGRERVLGVAVRALEAGELHLGAEAAERLTAQHDTVMAQTLRIELLALRTSQLLADRGVDHRLLKGAALAHSAGFSPSERSFRDVDVLVQSDDIDETVAMLQAVGAVRLQPELREGFDRRFGKSVTLRLDDGEIDVHRIVAPGPFGVWMRPGDLFVLKEQIAVAGVSIPTLDRTDHLIHACYHVALGQPVPVLSNLRDVALLASEGIDWDRVDETVQRWRGTAVMQRAIKLTVDRLNVEVPERLVSFQRAPVVADERIALNPYLTESPEGRFFELAPATLRALPLNDRPAFARAVGFPEGSDPVDRVRVMAGRLKSRK